GEDWGIGANGKLNADRRRSGQCSIVLVKPATDFSRLDANHRIIARSVVAATLDPFDTAPAFFEVGGVIQRVFNDIAEELRGSCSLAEEAALQERRQLPQYQFTLAKLRSGMAKRQRSGS